jgi:hypothetical protein
MTIPFKTYRDQLADMLMESVAGSTIISDWQYGGGLGPYWILKTPSVTPQEVWNVQETIYTLTWEAQLARGKADESGMGEQQTTVFQDLGNVMEYFQTKTQLLTSTQTVADNAIAFYVPRTLSCSALGDSFVGVRGGGQMRLLHFSISFQHKNQVNPQEQ